jgi:tetratricopeptide (TPR) repeat protein
MTHHFEAADEINDEMEILLHAVAGLAVRGISAEEFLDTFPTLLENIAPSLIPADLTASEIHQGTLMMARQFWNNLPLPDNHYQPLPLPKPERNSPCICGSGRKYKQCCLPMEHAMESSGNTLPLLPYVLLALPKKQLKDVPVLHLPQDQLATAVDEWVNNDPERILTLLEPAFADIHKIHPKHCWMYNSLWMTYDALNKPKKKQQLLQKCLQAPVRELRAEALQHQTSILCDQGKLEQARHTFQEAMRAAPDDPHLSHLEILLLQSEGKKDLASQRADYWIQKLKRDKQNDYSGLIEVLQSMRDGKNELQYEVASRDFPELALWTQTIKQLPAPALHYSLRGDDEMVEILADMALEKIQRAWQKIAPPLKPQLTQIFDTGRDNLQALAEWPQWLQQHPLAWQSFDILDDVILMFMDLPIDPAILNDNIIEPILNHSFALWQLLLEKKSATATVPWSFMNNRPALRLLAQMEMMHGAADQTEKQIQIIELMLLLNPTDNHGFREQLSNHLLRSNQLEKAIHLHALYTNDGPHLQFNHALALYALGKMTQAKAAALAACHHYPELPKMLLAKNPKQPKLSPGWVTHGGKDQAWYYREAMHNEWHKRGALEWLRKLDK